MLGLNSRSNYSPFLFQKRSDIYQIKRAKTDKLYFGSLKCSSLHEARKAI
jgi:hypothetical protein